MVITQSVCLNSYRSSFHRYSLHKSSLDEDSEDLSGILLWANSNTLTPLERLERLRILNLVAQRLDASQAGGRLTEQDRLIFEFRVGGMT